MVMGVTVSSQDVWKVLAEVDDPEIPALSIVDLGIVRRVEVENGAVRVVLTPTYSGCPAFEAIKRQVDSSLRNQGFERVIVETKLSPAWSSRDISEAGRGKLKATGIAPPFHGANDFGRGEAIRCPYCGSTRTVMRSEFGSTACKALRYCEGCNQPFEHFKSI